VQSAFAQETFVIAHGQVRFQLTHGIQRDTDHNQQTCSAKERCNQKRDVQTVGKQHREQTQRHKEHCTAESDPGHGRIQEVSSGLTGTDTGNITAFALEIFRNLQRIELRGDPEKVERHNQQTVSNQITAGVIVEPACQRCPVEIFNTGRGIIMIAPAKMIGITPAKFTFKGR